MVADHMDTHAYQQIQRSRDEIELDLIQLGREPLGLHCPHCQDDIMTRVEYKVTILTHAIAFIMGIFLWWMGGCFIPYLVRRWKDVEHYCPSCSKFLGVYWSFPLSVVLKETWRKIISQERREEFNKPNKSSVVCSDQFSISDMYYTAKGIRRLKQDAVPVVEMPFKELELVNDVANSGINVQTFPMEVETNSQPEASTSKGNRDMSSESSSLHSSKREMPNGSTKQRVAISPTSSELSSILNTPQTSFYKKTLRERNTKIHLKINLIKKLLQQNRRPQKRNQTLKTIIQELKKKRLLDEGLCNHLQQNTDECNILSVLTVKKKKSFEYPPALRKFALTVHFYSPAAYKYLRSVFNKRLPHPNTLFKWYQNVNAQPGLTEEAMSRLADRAKTSTKPLLCSMAIDEMSIRKQKIWTGKKCEVLRYNPGNCHPRIFIFKALQKK